MTARKLRRQASARAVIGWAAFVVFSICCAVAYTGVRDWGLAGLAALALVALLWTLGAGVVFTRSYWLGTPQQEAVCNEVDEYLDHLEASERHEAHREERHRRLHT